MPRKPPKSRSWEVWGRSGVSHLLDYWGNPNDPDVTGRHFELLNVVAHLIDWNTDVLDVCCGMGHLYPLVKHKIRTYLGVDNSVEMLAEGQHEFGEELFAHHDVFDLSNVPVFDTVVNISLIQHLPDRLIPLAVDQMWSVTGRKLILESPMSRNYHEEGGEEKSYAPQKLLIDRPIHMSFLHGVFNKLPNLESCSHINFSRRYRSTIYSLLKTQDVMSEQ